MIEPIDFRQWAASFDPETRNITVNSPKRGYVYEAPVSRTAPLPASDLTTVCDGSPGSYERFLDMLQSRGLGAYAAYYCGFSEGFVRATPFELKEVS